MEQYPVRKIEKPIDWCVTVPGSKSMTNRALLMAALSDGTVTLDGVLFSDDSRHFISSLTALRFYPVYLREKQPELQSHLLYIIKTSSPRITVKLHPIIVRDMLITPLI